MRRLTLAAPVALACVLIAAAGCDSAGNNAQPAAPPSDAATSTSPADPTETDEPDAPDQPDLVTTGAQASWPIPEDCVSYNPSNLTMNYAAGIYQVNDGSKVVVRVHGGPGEDLGDKAMALANRYRKHCYIGRNNGREDEGSYTFDYWRDSSGMGGQVPGQEDDCSGYDRGNLRADDMGGGDGWRVRDDDHILHVFNNENDAKNGRIVLSKYRQICAFGYNDDGQDFVTYSL